MISIDDRRKIMARAFFADNPDDFKNYEEALAEMQEGKVTESFLTFGTGWVDRAREPGHRILMNEVGHVASVREADMYFEPLTEFTMEEGDAFEAEYEKAAEKHQNVMSPIVILQNMGWKII